MSERPASDTSLIEAYDLLLLDLDGVVWLGEQPVPGASATITVLARQGVAIRYVTNNASRSANTVAGLLSRHKITATAEEVLTSAQAAVRLLADRVPAGSAVLVVGAPALVDEVAQVGLRPVREAVGQPVAVLQGFGFDVGWRQLAEAAKVLRTGAWWVATNTDRTFPSVDGPLPGNGALVAALRTATGRDPDLVVGKPEPTLFTTAVDDQGSRSPLVVGDRLDTDVRGAVRAGYDSVLVLTGVTRPAELLAAAEGSRPNYVAAGLRDLLARYPSVTVTERGVRCRGWRVAQTGDGWSLSSDRESADVREPVDVAGSDHGTEPLDGAASSRGIELSEGAGCDRGTELPDVAGGGPGTRLSSDALPPDAVDALRALCTAVWAGRSRGGRVGRIVAGSPEAAAALQALDLADTRNE